MFAYEFRHSGKDFTITSLALKHAKSKRFCRRERPRPCMPAWSFSPSYFFTIDYGGFRVPD